MEMRPKKKTKKEVGWNPKAPIICCGRCKHYSRLLGNYEDKPTCEKNGFRTKGFAVCDDFERL